MLTSSLISMAIYVFVVVLPGEGKGADNASLHFRRDVSRYEAEYLENREALISLGQILNEAGTEGIESIHVVAYASPEGVREHNLKLSRARAAALPALVEQYLPAYASLITVEAGGEAWEPLRQRIVQDTLINEASRSKILRILDDNSVGPDTKKWRLENRLGNDPVAGNLYRYLLNEHYKYLRCLYITVSYKEKEPEETVQPAPEPAPVPVVPDVEPQPQVIEPEPIPEETAPASDTIYTRPILAVSTNLLYDLAITPNVAVEVPLGKHWSVYADYTFPWWVNRTNNMAWQQLKFDVGGRYWFGRRGANDPMEVLRGHFVGLDLGIGYYDLEPRHTGWQGEFLTAGLEYGYGWVLGKNKKWRLDAFGGAGIIYTHYRYYEGNAGDTKLLWQYNGRYTWFGPVKLGASIKYIFTTKKPRRQSK